MMVVIFSGAFTSKEELMQEEYRKFFGLEFDKNIEDVTRYILT